MSKGDKVPDVITTDWNLSKMGRMAMDASKHLKCMTGLMTLGVLSSEGSMMIVKPLVYVDTRVAKCEMTVKGEKSLACETSKVRIKLASRSAANRSGFRSMQTFLAISKRQHRCT